MKPKRSSLYNYPQALASMRYDQKWRIPTPEAFRTWLVRARRSCSPPLSQRELGALAGLHHQAIASIERGRREPSLEVANRLWRILHAAFQGKLWIGVQIRRDNRDSVARGKVALDATPVKLRKLNPDSP